MTWASFGPTQRPADGPGRPVGGGLLRLMALLGRGLALGSAQPTRKRGARVLVHRWPWPAMGGRPGSLSFPLLSLVHGAPSASGGFSPSPHLPLLLFPMTPTDGGALW